MLTRKNIAIGLTGFVLGAAAGTAFGWYLVGKKLEKAYDEDIAAIREMVGDLDLFPELSEVDDVFDVEDGDEVVVTKDVRALGENYEGHQRVNYSRLGAGSELYIPSEDDLDVFNNVIGEEDGDHIVDDDDADPPTEWNMVLRGEKPYKISKQQYLTENLQFEKATLFYFTGDKGLVDEMDQEVDVESQEILFGGIKWRSSINARRPVYIRNEGNGCDYEICQISGNAAELVSLVETPYERRKRLGARMKKHSLKGKAGK